ncbi:cytoplasmic dynein 2 light intermediate chain 1 [Cimex lectularius]|uniref:Cytoplasmic dynein 2 light intermediate chain 1 n=1 Tax=Cimex lectularius TaxID=79782 RepID=A0A8I6S2H1_CIMLE|nr:cytoplasmic dynein 2 light intermediate chain 1 [Cimex lectularius]
MDKNEPIAERIPELILPNDGTLLDKVSTEANLKSSEIGFVRPDEKTLLVVGSRGVGKTTLIVQTFNLNEEITPTLALEYFFSTQMTEYDHHVCNIWELGGGTTFSPTLYALEDMPNMTAVVMVDLSSPSTLFNSAESSIKIINDFAEKRNDVDDLKKQALDRVPDEHPDKKYLTPCPTQLVIIGGKYDAFQEFDPEPKRIICSFLRFLANKYYAHLVFYSNKNNNLITITKNVLNHFAFGNELSGKVQLDHNYPLIVQPGKDSFQAIDSSDGPPYSTEKYKKLLDVHFSQVPVKDKPIVENPRFDSNFKEPTIDALRVEKDECLERLCQELEMEMKVMGRAQ